MREENIDCLKYRKSTHLAGCDIETIIQEKGNCILTIKIAFYDTLDVNGKKLEGYYIDFHENVKQFKVNSTNRKTIAKILKTQYGLDSVSSRNIGNWKDLKIELIFDETVRMKGEVTGGIRISEKALALPTLEKDTEIFAKCKNAIASGTYSIEQIKSKYKLTEEIEKLLLS